MANKTAARSTGKVTLVANTTQNLLITEDADYVEIVNSINATVYVTITAIDAQPVDPAAIETLAVLPLGVGRFRFAAGQYVNVECASAGDICVQLGWTL